jgi:hypothetical protein
MPLKHPAAQGEPQMPTAPEAAQAASQSQADATAAFELTGDPQHQLPNGERLTGMDQLVGHTIKAAVGAPSGSYGGDDVAVILTATGCWIVLEARPDGLESVRCYVEVRQPSRFFGDAHIRESREESISDFLSPFDMLNAGLIDDVAYSHLLAREQAKTAKRSLAKADQLEREAAALRKAAGATDKPEAA